MENQIDSELKKLENLEDDDIENLRQRRIQELKKCGGVSRPGCHAPLPRSPCGACVVRRGAQTLPPTLAMLQAAAEACRVGTQGARRVQ